MKLLQDTHAFLWMHAEPERLSAPVRARLVDADQEIVLSVVVAWEIGIKVARNKLTIPEPVDDFITVRRHRSGMQLLPIDLAHVLDSGALPPHHADPFDRMLVAQARVENLTILTADPWIARYDVEILSAS